MRGQAHLETSSGKKAASSAFLVPKLFPEYPKWHAPSCSMSPPDPCLLCGPVTDVQSLYSAFRIEHFATLSWRGNKFSRVKGCGIAWLQPQPLVMIWTPIHPVTFTDAFFLMIPPGPGPKKCQTNSACFRAALKLCCDSSKGVTRFW